MSEFFLEQWSFGCFPCFFLVRKGVFVRSSVRRRRRKRDQEEKVAVISLEEARLFDGGVCGRLARLVREKRARERRAREKFETRRLRKMFEGAGQLVD
jgi:hypothetical protein